FTCASASQPGEPDGDEFPCFPASFSSLVPVSGCLDQFTGDFDFDGPSYQPGSWPGTGGAAQDAMLHPSAMSFTSATYGAGHDFRRIAFETNMPGIEPGCNTGTGEGCTNPPADAAFYPWYTTGMDRGRCFWRHGGGGIPGMTNDFGGSPT